MIDYLVGNSSVKSFVNASLWLGLLFFLESRSADKNACHSYLRMHIIFLCSEV